MECEISCPCALEFAAEGMQCMWVGDGKDRPPWNRPTEIFISDIHFRLVEKYYCTREETIYSLVPSSAGAKQCSATACLSS